MSSLTANKGRLTIGGVICSPNGTIKSPLNLTADVPGPLRRRFIPLPCELRHSIAARNAMADTLLDLFDVGSTNAEGRIRIYTSKYAQKPDQLATILMANPAFGPAVSGVAPGLNLPWSDSLAEAAGTAAAFSAFDRDDNLVLTGDVALSGEEITMPHLEIAVNDIVKLLSVSYTASP